MSGFGRGPNGGSRPIADAGKVRFASIDYELADGVQRRTQFSGGASALAKSTDICHGHGAMSVRRCLGL